MIRRGVYINSYTFVNPVLGGVIPIGNLLLREVVRIFKVTLGCVIHNRFKMVTLFTL